MVALRGGGRVLGGPRARGRRDRVRAGRIAEGALPREPDGGDRGEDLPADQATPRRGGEAGVLHQDRRPAALQVVPALPPQLAVLNGGGGNMSGIDRACGGTRPSTLVLAAVL